MTRTRAQRPAHNLFSAHVARMKKLTPPKSDRTKVEDYLSVLDMKAKALNDIWEASMAHDGPLIARLYKQGAQIDKRADSIATGLGLNVCVRAP